MKHRIHKAVFPVAGLGTRFLPATKAAAKEMLPVVDKPIIQYAAEEAVEAGMTELIFVTGRSKRSIEDHFDKSVELEFELQSRQKFELLDVVRNIVPPGVACIFIRQAEALGLGHAVLCAKPAVGDAPFAVMLPDDLIDNDGPGCLAQMVDTFAETGSSILAVETVNAADTEKYGMVKTQLQGALGRLEGIIEKPKPADAPSNLGVVGRYILTPSVFDLLERTERGAGGEIQLTDAIAQLLTLEPVFAYAFTGSRYDCGTKIGFLQATVELALKHPQVNGEFRDYLRALVGGPAFSN